MRRWKRIVSYGVAVLVTFFLLVAVGRFLIAPGMIFPGCNVALPPAGDPRLPANVSVVDYGYDVRLRGAWVKAKKPNGLTVVFFHGNAESAATGLDLGIELAERGSDIFLAEYRGYAGMPSSPSEEGLHRDALAAVDVVRSTGVANERLVLVGRSLGSGLAIELARKGHGCAVILLSPYTSIVEIARGIAGPLAPLVIRDRFESLLRIPRVFVPVTVIHGTQDTLIPYEHGKQIAAAAPMGKLVPVEGRGHNDLPAAALVAAELSVIRSGLATK